MVYRLYNFLIESSLVIRSTRQMIRSNTFKLWDFFLEGSKAQKHWQKKLNRMWNINKQSPSVYFQFIITLIVCVYVCRRIKYVTIISYVFVFNSPQNICWLPSFFSVPSLANSMKSIWDHMRSFHFVTKKNLLLMHTLERWLI